MLTQRDHLITEITYVLIYHYDNGTHSCAKTDTGLTVYLGSGQTAFTWHDRPYPHAQMDRGGADSCAKLTTNRTYQTELFMSSRMLKMLSKG